MDCLDCKFKSEAFKQLTPAQLLRIDEHRTELSFKQGELLSKQGMLISQIIYVTKGFAKLYLEHDNEITTIALAKPGTFIGIQTLYGQTTSAFSVEALTDVEVCMKDITVFREMVLENPGFARGIIELLNTELTQSYKRTLSLTKKHINARFSEMLFYLSDILYQSNPFDLALSRRDLADLIATTPESISRLIKEFKKQGLIEVKGHSLKIIDRKKLKAVH